MRVLVICNGYPSRVEPDKGPFIREQVRWLAKWGHKVEVARLVRFNVTPAMLTPGRRILRSWKETLKRLGTERKAELDGVVVHYLRVVVPPGRAWPGIVPDVVQWQVGRSLERIAEEFRPDLIHSHFLYPNLFVGQALSERLGVGHIVSVMGDDARLYCDRRGIRNRTAEGLRRVDGIIVKSKSLKSMIMERYDAVESKVRVIFNGVDLERFHVVERLTSQPVVLFVGRFCASKDLAGNLIPALARLASLRADFVVDMVGDGPEREQVEGLARRLGLSERLRFHGSVPHHRIRDFIARSRVVVLSSHSEGTPNVIMESLACGVPVVATAVGGVPEIVGEECGILVPPRRPYELGTALAEALSREWDPMKIRGFACTHLDIRKQIAKIDTLYSEIRAKKTQEV